MKGRVYGGVLLLAAAAFAAGNDVVEVLARFGEMLRGNSAHMTNFTCVETIERKYFSARLARPARSCDDLSAEKRRKGYKLTLESSDRLRLDVRAEPTTESYSWPGAERFDDRELWDIIGYGPAATGPFAMFLKQILQGDATDFAFVGETEAGGKRLYQYTFRTPQERSHYYIRMADGTMTTAWDGTLLLDPETSELARMTTRTSELPPEAFACELTSDSDYGYVTVGERRVLLPKETRQRFVSRTGEEVEGLVTFSGCRAYQAESNVSFGAVPGKAPSAAKPVGGMNLNLPAGLPVTIELTSEIDSSTAAGGDRFTGRLAKPIVGLDDRTLVQQGAFISGRLTKVATHVKPAEVALVLHVETVQVDGVNFPLHLTGRTPPKRGDWLFDILSNLTISGGGASAGGGVSGIRVERHPAPSEGEVDVLRFPGTSKVLEAGYRTEWMTVGF